MSTTSGSSPPSSRSGSQPAEREQAPPPVIDPWKTAALHEAERLRGIQSPNRHRVDFAAVPRTTLPPRWSKSSRS